MSDERTNTEDQAAIWNGVAGQAWVDAQEIMDEILAPFLEALKEALAGAPIRHVLDVGCGTGATTLAFARAVGAEGRVVGVDISEPMLALARTRAEREHVRATFVRADAATHAFESQAFDAIVSRFGVMFFEDPLRAFTNLRRTAADGARLRCVVWRSAAENPFMTAAERAAAPLLPNLPSRRAEGPGQFAFGDRDRVRRLLTESGWAEVDLQPLDRVCTFAASALEQYVMRLGPLGRALHDVDEATRERVLRTVRAAFDGYIHGNEARFDAACWMVNASAR